jgi:hypothetical protein
MLPYRLYSRSRRQQLGLVLGDVGQRQHFGLGAVGRAERLLNATAIRLKPDAPVLRAGPKE